MNRQLIWVRSIAKSICAMVKSRYIGDGHPTFNRNPYNGYINPYYWVDDHPLLYGNNGSLDPGTYAWLDLTIRPREHETQVLENSTHSTKFSSSQKRFKGYLIG